MVELEERKGTVMDYERKMKEEDDFRKMDNNREFSDNNNEHPQHPLIEDEIYEVNYYFRFSQLI